MNWRHLIQKESMVSEPTQWNKQGMIGAPIITIIILAIIILGTKYSARQEQLGMTAPVTVASIQMTQE